MLTLRDGREHSGSPAAIFGVFLVARQPLFGDRQAILLDAEHRSVHEGRRKRTLIVGNLRIVGRQPFGLKSARS